MFDDDLDSESIQASRVKESGPRKKKGVPKGKGNIRNMLVGMAAKKETQVKLDEDDVLKDLMAELKSAKAESPKTKKREPNKFLVPNKSKMYATDRPILSRDLLTLFVYRPQTEQETAGASEAERQSADRRRQRRRGYIQREEDREESKEGRRVCSRVSNRREKEPRDR